MSERYSRQQRFLPIGEKGQQALAQKQVLIVGVGALGATIAELLTRAGIGKIVLVDRDFIELSNLHRQLLYNEQDVAKRLPKVIAAKNTLQTINSDVEIIAHVANADASFLENLIQQHTFDIIFDGTDNFDIRFIINDIAHKYHIPWLYGACVGANSINYFIAPTKTPCLHCILGTMPSSGPTCDTLGIIAPAAQITASLQVTEALKYLTHNEDALRGTVFTMDIWQNTFSSVNVASLKKPTCPTCGTQPTYPFLIPQATTQFAVLCGRDSIQIRPPQITQRDLLQLAKQLPSAVITHQNAFLLSFEVDNLQLTAFVDGRVLIHGTQNITTAQKMYYQYF